MIRPGEVRIARWPGGRRAALLLQFDDSVPSHIDHAIPALAARGLTGTFYINPGTGHFASRRAAWEGPVAAAGMELGNHTMTHGGLRDAAHALREIDGCNDAIRAATPHLPWPRLVSWGRPGVNPGAWTIADGDLDQALARNLLVPRPSAPGRSPGVHVHSAADMLAVADAAIAAGGLDRLGFHGVGGDWHACQLPAFLGLLDGLVMRRDRLWVTGHMAAHQYAAERDSATIAAEPTDEGFRIALSCACDPRLYRQPLTLIAAVAGPRQGWVAIQGAARRRVAIRDGLAMFEALPGPEPIRLAPAA